MVAPPDQNSFNASEQSGSSSSSSPVRFTGIGGFYGQREIFQFITGQTWASDFSGRGGDDGGASRSGKDFETLSQSLAGKSESSIVGEADNLSLSDSNPSVSPMIDTISDKSAMSEVVSYEIEKEEISDKESKNGLIYDKVKKVDDLVSDDGIEEERSLVSGEVDDDDEKRYESLVEEEIVNLISSESVNVDKNSVSNIVSEFEFRDEGKEIDKRSSGERGVGISESDKEPEEMIFGSNKDAGQFMEESEKASFVNEIHSDETSVLSNQLDRRIDGQIVTDSDVESEEETFDTEALAALLKAFTGGSSDSGNLGSSLRLLQPAATRTNRSNIFPNPQVDESESNLSEEEKQKLENLQSIRVKYLRLVHRLGQSVDDSVAAQVLYRLAVLSGRRSGQSFSLDAAKKIARESEAEGNKDLNFSLNILVLGKSGVGKSATINSILGDQKVSVDAFGPSTNSVRKISGTVNGVEITIIDTPGLKSYATDQSANSKTLSSVKKVIKNCPPDVVLYIDRLDDQNRGLNSMPLLRTITDSLGSSIWGNAIVTLTHASSAPPDGPSGTPLSYDVFVAQCSHIVQQSIGQAVGDLRFINPSLMNPVSLVENHPLCRKNREGVKVLPNGQTWRPQLLLLCYSLKVLSEAKSLLKHQEPLDNRKYLWSRLRSLPLPNLLSWLLQSRAHPKLPAEQGEDSIDSDFEIDDSCDLEQEDDEYDQLPPYKPLPRAQLDKLSKEHREAYFDEYHYRVKLLQKKQWREELRKMREMKKNGKKKVGESEVKEEEEAPPASLRGLSPDLVLPPSFDSDDSVYRYRSLEETNSQFITKSMLDSQGWDHDAGLNRVIAEYNHAIANRFPTGVSVEMTKDKKDFNVLLNSSVCAKHGDNGSSMGEFLIRGNEQLMYLMKGETKFKSMKKNKTTLGGLLTYMDGIIANGFKIDHEIPLGRRLVLVGNAGTSRSRGDAAFEGNLEIRLREDDFPIGQNQSALGVTLTKSKDDLTVTGNIRSQVSIGRQTKLAVSASLDSKRTGHINIRTTGADSLQIAFMAILPIIMSIYKKLFPSGQRTEKDL